MKVVLASNSPRRKDLLKKIVDDFSVVPSTAPEVCFEHSPAEYAQQLAQLKAHDVCKNIGATANEIVIGCDTVVDLDGTILGKPKSAAEAFEMLSALSDKTHLVHTGVCIVVGDREFNFVESTEVTFGKLTDKEIQRYVDSGSPLDKAGAYGIQDCDFVLSFNGSYDNVVGFPTESIAAVFEKIYKR